MKKRYLLIILSVVLVFIIGWQLYRIYEQRDSTSEEVEEVDTIRSEEEQELAFTYLRLHYAFYMAANQDELYEHWTARIEEARNIGKDDHHIEGYEEVLAWELEQLYRWRGKYFPLDLNSYGIDVITYLILQFYYIQTGIDLAWEVVADYFSEEYEPDGELRLYNNGNHTEIEAFVTWMWEERMAEKARDYRDEIDKIRNKYVSENRDNGFESRALTDFSPQMLDALIRAEADSDYELDLTSLQEQGY